MAAITYDDVATTIGRPISDSDERAQVTQWISDVELILGVRLGSLAALDQDVLAYVEREAVAARMRYRSDRNSEGGETASEDNFFLNILKPWWALFSDEEGSTAYSIPVSSPLDVA